MSDQPNLKPALKPGPFEEHAIRPSVPVPSTLPSEELQRIEAQPLAALPAPSVGEMLAMVVRGVTEKGLTAENAQVMEKLMGLYERAEARQAEKDFNTAFVRLQDVMPKVNATVAVHCKDGSDKYKFAPLENIIAEVGPCLKECGFSFSFSQKPDNDGLIEIFTLRHVGGHSHSNEFRVRTGSGPPGCSITQADGAASQYARRYAFCDGLGIVISHIDRDATADGAFITREQAEKLAERVNLTNSDRAMFLKLAGAESFFEIRAAKYDLLDELLTKKEKRGR